LRLISSIPPFTLFPSPKTYYLQIFPRYTLKLLLDQERMALALENTLHEIQTGEARAGPINIA